MITIITVTKNDIHGLRKTIENIKSFNISGELLEHLIVDGNSRDGTIEYLNNLNNIRYINDPGSGIYQAMNLGVKHAKGDAILFLNSGDTLNSDINIKEIFSNLNYKTTVYCFRAKLIYKNDIYLAPAIYNKRTNIDYIVHQAILSPKSILEEYPFIETHSISSDSIWKRIIFQKSEVSYNNEIISNFELGGISNSASWESTLKYLKQNYEIKYKFKYLIKFLIRLIFGQRLMYRILFLNKYKKY